MGGQERAGAVAFHGSCKFCSCPSPLGRSVPSKDNKTKLCLFKILFFLNTFSSHFSQGLLNQAWYTKESQIPIS